MYSRLLCTCLLLALGSWSVALTAQPELGPVIRRFGPVMAPPPGAYNLDPDVQYNVSMDVSSAADDPGRRNVKIESAARFLNMHARNGIPPENMDFALIVHGGATRDLLTDAAYEARYDEPNPNTELLAALKGAGVAIYLCSQSAAFMNMQPDEFSATVTMAVSAMTAHVRLQQEGYTLIPF